MTPTEKIDSFYLRHLPLPLAVITLTVLSNKLAMMQTEGCFTAGATFVTALFGVTSLLYARARTAPNSDETERRSKIADECLKLTLLSLMGFVITAFCYLSLAEKYQPRLGHMIDPKTPPELAPFLTSIACIVIFGIPIISKANLVLEMTLTSLGIKPEKLPKNT